MTVAGLFDRVRKIDGRVTRRFAGLAIVAFGAPFLVFGIAGIRVNATSSLPMGFYKKTKDSRAPLVEFCPEAPYGEFAAVRGYRPAGNCRDGAGPLMKPVIAKAGDVVEVSGSGISVNGILLPNTAAKTKDSRGRQMKPWEYGRYKVPIGFVWVASSYNTWSFDSRYFGPIPVGIIRNRLEPFLTL